jgi:hypothetical protein
MEQNGQGGRPARGINQNMVIAIIGAVATIVAALIPSFNNGSNSQTAPTAAATIAALPSDTVLPSSTFTFAPESTATETLTPTLLPPTETPTTPVGIYDVYLALDKAGQNRSTTFGPLQTVYIFFSINDLSGQNLVRVQWLTLDVPGRIPDSSLGGDESKISTPKYSFEITLSPWPVGTYKAILYLNGSAVSTTEFEIR